MPIIGALGVWMVHEWFGVSWLLGALSIPLIIVLTLIAASSTALTGITPIRLAVEDPAVHVRRARSRAPGDRTS